MVNHDMASPDQNRPVGVGVLDAADPHRVAGRNVTAADHANTVRQVLRYEAAQPGLDRALAALDALQAKAETADQAAANDGENFVRAEALQAELASMEDRAEAAEQAAEQARNALQQAVEAMERMDAAIETNSEAGTPDWFVNETAIARAALAGNQT